MTAQKRIAQYTIQIVLKKQMLTRVQENIDFVRSWITEYNKKLFYFIW